MIDKIPDMWREKITKSIEGDEWNINMLILFLVLDKINFLIKV